jgi:subtilisin-like proprotein convertase family protein
VFYGELKRNPTHLPEVKMIMRTGLLLITAAAICALMASPALAKTKTRTFGGPTFQPIGDNSVSVAGFTVGRKKDGKVLDVNAHVRITHGEDNDLTLYVLSPKGRLVQLVNRRPNTGNGFGTGTGCGTPVTFDDLAATTLPAAGGNSLVLGTFRPFSPLSALNGASSRGRWSLIVADHDPGRQGSINCFELTIRQKE